MTDAMCSIIETVYNMPELKSCPIETTFKIIGKRWTVLIIREMLRGHKQFNRFMENIEGISPKVLTERLRELEHLGIVRRKIVSEYPIKIEYSLTDLGKGFLYAINVRSKMRLGADYMLQNNDVIKIVSATSGRR